MAHGELMRAQVLYLPFQIVCHRYPVNAISLFPNPSINNLSSQPRDQCHQGQDASRPDKSLSAVKPPLPKTSMPRCRMAKKKAIRKNGRYPGAAMRGRFRRCRIELDFRLVRGMAGRRLRPQRRSAPAGCRQKCKEEIIEMSSLDFHFYNLPKRCASGLARRAGEPLPAPGQMPMHDQRDHEHHQGMLISEGTRLTLRPRLQRAAGGTCG